MPPRGSDDPSDPTDETPWLIVGLGNPGPSYSGNRHNLGFMVLDELARRTGARLKSHKGRADVGAVRVAGKRAVLEKPRSFMNESGGPTASVRDYFHVPTDRVIVVHDELDIPFGALRLKQGGGDGGHNGLKSLRTSLKSGEFLRVRVGIGRPPGRMDAAAYVLKDFAGSERKELPLVVSRAADAVEALISEGLERAQMTYNGDA
jgi:peptidyl-tRNA hydrolase, PTH1 family